MDGGSSVAEPSRPELEEGLESRRSYQHSVGEGLSVVGWVGPGLASGEEKPPDPAVAGRLEDTQEGIRRIEEAVAATPVDHPDRATMLANLGKHLSTRYDRTGALEDLQEAILRFEEAVAAAPVGYPDRAGMLTNLGNCLSTRFGWTGALEDLQEGIRRSEEAVAATPVDHPDRAGRLSNLGKHLSTRFDRTGALEDLQEAIRLGEEAVAATPVDHPDRGRRLDNLANRLSTQFDRRGDDTFLAERSGPYHHPSVDGGSLEQQGGKHPIKTVESGDVRGAGSTIQMAEYENAVTAAPQVCTDKWPALFAHGKTDIHFDDSNRWSLSNEIKGWIENKIGARVNWWPLCARREALRDGFSRVTWKCVSRAFSENGKVSH